MIRYHSFYPWHCEKDYDYLCDDNDRQMLTWVKEFKWVIELFFSAIYLLVPVSHTVNCSVFALFTYKKWHHYFIHFVVDFKSLWHTRTRKFSVILPAILNFFFFFFFTVNLTYTQKLIHYQMLRKSNHTIKASLTSTALVC